MKPHYLLFPAAFLFLAACENDGPAEELGEEVDEAADEMEDAAN